MNTDEILTEWKDYKRKGHQYDVWGNYKKWLWNEIDPILHKFIEYVKDKENWENYGGNCDNSFYYHSGTRYLHHVRWPGTKVMCKIMSTALFFLTAPDGLPTFTHGAHDTEQKLRQLIGCTIVNIFMYILEKTVCEGHWGLQYAWHVMREEMQGIPGNIVAEGKCLEGFIDNVNLGSWSMKEKIKEWIQHNTDLRTWVQDTEIKKMCKTAQEESKQAGRKGTEKGTWQAGGENTDNYGETAVREKMDRGLKDVIGRAMNEIMQKVGDHLQGAGQPARTGAPGTAAEKPGSGTHAAAGPNAPTTKPGGAQHDSNNDTRRAEHNTHGSTAAKPVAPPAAPASAAPAAAGSGAVGQGPGPGPGPGQQPPPPPPPPPEKTSGGTQGGKDADQAGKCTESSTSTNKKGTGVDVSFGCTSDKELGAPDIVPPNPPDPEPGKNSYAS
ncbi:hypothetical protein AK88_05203 [Plasmodium fragile]|uniref:Schizont-infected cell agglutination extracellular alpha domain-containing protein n=1 Tax=Plasmodium fragile TaxID=5857 RepID=A0A0D9QDN6_PLAFR|nr:uncharacterized protein AK88_05203 [Plasmodium fragile]KJP85160.1 hypothetical protein AK88_05203 [Plasmodium fragile]